MTSRIPLNEVILLFIFDILSLVHKSILMTTSLLWSSVAGVFFDNNFYHGTRPTDVMLLES